MTIIPSREDRGITDTHIYDLPIIDAKLHATTTISYKEGGNVIQIKYKQNIIIKNVKHYDVTMEQVIEKINLIEQNYGRKHQC